MYLLIDILIVMTMIGIIGGTIGLAMKIAGFFYNLVQKNRG